MTTADTELAQLRHDVEVFGRVLATAPDLLKPLADFTDSDKHAQYLVVANLAWQIWEYALSVEALLRQELHSSAIIILRSAYETVATLAYIAKHDKSQDEAVICLAFSYVRQVEYFKGQPLFVDEVNGILNKMPKHLVEEAQRRSKTKPWTWSGLNMRELTEAATMTGYAEAYGYFSAETHGTMLGQHVRIVNQGDGTAKLEAGRKISAESVESAANMARRLFHSAFKILWEVFNGPRIQFPSTDPDEWVRAQKK